MGRTLLLLAVLLTLYGGLNAVEVYKDSKLKFVGSEPLNKHDKAQYRDCHHLRREGGYKVSGIYRLHVNNSVSFQVQCEHTADNSYTVIQRRNDGVQPFEVGFEHYRYGFGHISADYWAGLNNIYHLTSTGNTVLRVVLQTWTGEIQTVYYKHFRLMDAARFTLQIGGYIGNITDDMSFCNGMPFSTYDRPDVNNCATNQKAGWWYNYCAYALPNGKYYYGGRYNPGTYWDGMYWADWMGYDYSMKFFSLSLSPYV